MKKTIVLFLTLFTIQLNASMLDVMEKATSGAWETSKEMVKTADESKPVQVTKKYSKKAWESTKKYSKKAYEFSKEKLKKVVD